jgi:hypothetical protein
MPWGAQGSAMRCVHALRTMNSDHRGRGGDAEVTRCLSAWRMLLHADSMQRRAAFDCPRSIARGAHRIA